MEEIIDFEEKQYLGFNKFNITIRTTIAIFCFLSAYYSPGDNGELFLIIGTAALILSVGIIFVLHIHTKIFGSQLEIRGWWGARMVKIELENIVKVEKIRYSKFLLNRPVYNLHLKGKVRFFTRGNDAVKLTDKEGLVYVIGSQRADEMVKIIRNKISN